MSEDDSRPSPASEPQERRRGWLERLSSAISGEPSNREDLVELLRDTHADGSLPLAADSPWARTRARVRTWATRGSFIGPGRPR